MNYYLFQSKFFIVLIAVAAMAFSAMPFVNNSFADISDQYIQSQLNRLQSEMLYINARKGSFKGVCVTGEVNGIVVDLIKRDDLSLVCRANEPYYSKMIACARMKNKHYYCVDSLGTICEVSGFVRNGYGCKEI